MTPRHSSDDLFAEHDDPKPNSREDTGFTRPGTPRDPDIDTRPPSDKSFGEPSPGPDPVPRNACSSAIQIDDARKFVTWIHDQNFPIHEDVTVGHVLVALSGLGTPALGWLCRACRQAERAPAPAVMREAAMKRDVDLLRPGEGPEKTDVKRQKS